MDQVNTVINQAIDESIFPGAVIKISRQGETILQKAYGSFFGDHISNDADHPDFPVNTATVFDLGSLTAAVGTVVATMRLVDQGVIRLDDQVIRYNQGFSVYDKAPINIGDLLFHISGLATDLGYHEELLNDTIHSRFGIITSPGAKEYVLNRINRSRLRSKVHEQQRFSALGMILLGNILEVVSGKSLEQLLHEQVFKPLGMTSTGYINLNSLKTGVKQVHENIAATENCHWRKKQIWGEVQNDNAWTMGGIAGNAGLFSSVDDLSLLTSTLMSVLTNASNFIQQETLHNFWDYSGEVRNWRYVGGWERPHPDNGMDEVGFSDQSVGYLASSGCTIWLDSERDLEIIFLSNAMCPSRNNKKVYSFMPVMVETLLSNIK